ncbi:MAG: hypothetical protein PHG24_01275 [Candidatus Pacebacteria bacterium]|nr:hypothetical protein [Candidatus Paceibacterota bacterium]
MKKQILTTTLVFFFVLANITYAANTNAGSQAGDKTPNQVQGGEQIQVTTQNQEQVQAVDTGEGHILIEKQQNANSENGQNKPNVSDETKGQQSNGNANGNTVQTQENNQGEETKIQNRSNVADAVQKLLETSQTIGGGIGPQVRVIAQAQNENNLKLEASVEKVQSRNSFSKAIIGPDYAEINKAEALLEENKLQIQELTQLKDQLMEEAGKQVLAEQIELLNNANSEIETILDNSQKGFSLLGWVFKLFK